MSVLYVYMLLIIAYSGGGQIAGIADSGLDDSSCFFADDALLTLTAAAASAVSVPYSASAAAGSSSSKALLTNRTGLLQPERRKVIQYTAYADAIDDQGEVYLTLVAAITAIITPLSVFSPVRSV